jgi:DNA-binding transcriptional regulator YiaG
VFDDVTEPSFQCFLWEQGRCEPGQPARAYLTVIAMALKA